MEEQKKEEQSKPKIKIQDGRYWHLTYLKERIREDCLTNWTIDLKAVCHNLEEQSSHWVAILETIKGESEVTIPVEAFSNVRELRKFLLRTENSLLFFKGSDDELMDLIDYFSLTTQPKKIILLNYVGDTDYGFVTENFIYKSGQLWTFKDGYAQISENESIKIIPLIVRGKRESELPVFQTTEPAGGFLVYKKRVYDLMVKNRNLKVALGIGWVKSCLWADMFLERERFFPLLVLHGESQSGKSVFRQWLMEMVGLGNVAPERISSGGSTEVGVERRFAYYSNLPICLEDYRPDRSGEHFHNFIRSAFDRSSSSKGIKLDAGIRRMVMRSCLMLTSQYVPTDTAIQSRAVLLELTIGERKDRYFGDISKLAGNLSAIGFEWLKNRENDFERFHNKYLECLKLLLDKTGDARQSQVYAVALAGAITEDVWSEEELWDTALAICKIELSARKSEEILNLLWEAAMVLKLREELKEQSFSINLIENEVIIHLPSLIATIKGSQYTRHYTLPSHREVAKLLKQRPYVKKAGMVMVGGNDAWRWVIDLSIAPSVLGQYFPKEPLAQDFGL